jgi:hypothetical protein
MTSNHDQDQTSATVVPQASTSSRLLWQHRWFRVFTYITVVIIAILIAIPLVAKQQLTKYLLENGADYAAIKDIDFNPFAGSFVLDGMDVKVADKTVMSDSTVQLDLSWRSVFQKGIVLEKVKLRGVTVEIEQLPEQRWRVGSLIFGASGEGQEEAKKEISWWLGLGKFELKESRIRIISPRLDAVLHLDNITIDSFDNRPGDIDTNIAAKLRLNESPLNADINLTQLTPALNMKGTLDLGHINLADLSGLAGETLQTLNGLVDAKGSFGLKSDPSSGTDASYKGIVEARNTEISGSAFTTTGDVTRWDGDFELAMKDGNTSQRANISGSLNTAAPAVKLPGQNLDASSGSINWQGDIEYTGTGSNRGVRINGQLDGKEIAVSMIEQNMNIHQRSVSAATALELKFGADTSDVAGTAALQLDGLSVTDTAKQLVLLAFESLGINGVTAESLQKASIADITMTGASLIQQVNSDAPSVTIGDTKITTLDWDGAAGLGIDNITVSKLTGTMIRAEDGSIDLIKALQRSPDATVAAPPDNGAEDTAQAAAPPEETEATLKPAVEGTTEATTPAKPLQMRVGDVRIQNNSQFTFVDNSVSPKFETALIIDSMEIKDIDSAKPEQPIAIKLHGQLDKYATLDVAGNVKPFSAPPAVDLTINLDDQNMVPLSSYLISSTGYLVQAGQLDFDSKIVIKDGVIDAKNKAFMKKLKLTEADGELVKKNAGEIGMPLDRALGMLRDKNDNITLEIPIQGKLDELDIGTSQIINTVLKKATTAGMKTYLLYAFQPYGALIIAGEMAGKQLGKISLDPVIFEPGKADLTAQHKDYLSKLGKVMKDRPKIDVRVCGYTTMADLGGTKPADSGKKAAELSKKQIEAMIALGSERMNAIKKHMISTFKIDAGRLILCAPEHDRKDGAKPRVELLI